MAYFLNLLIISLIFYPFGQYNYVFRFISINDFRVIILLLISYILTTNGIYFLITFFEKVYLSITTSNIENNQKINLFNSIFFSFLVLVNRLFNYQFLYYFQKEEHRQKSFYLWSWRAGLQTSNSLKTIRNYYIEGFIDDNRNKIGTKLNNKYVYSFKEASELIQEKNITDILIAIPSIGIKERRNIFDKSKELRVNIKILPGIQDLISGRLLTMILKISSWMI